MDLLEYKQIAEAVKYIENYDYNNDIKFSDVNYDKKLSDFEIKDEAVGYRTIGEGNDRQKISYGYNNGCTEGQIKLFRMILLSAKYNYNELESDLLSETDKQQIKEDVSKGKYKGKSLDDYEKLRLEAIDETKNSNNFVDKLQTIQEHAKEINKGIFRIAQYKLIKDAVTDEKVQDAAERMIRDGLPITQIAEYLQTDILKLNDIYFKLLEEKEEGKQCG